MDLKSWLFKSIHLKSKFRFKNSQTQLVFVMDNMCSLMLKDVDVERKSKP